MPKMYTLASTRIFSFFSKSAGRRKRKKGNGVRTFAGSERASEHAAPSQRITVDFCLEFVEGQEDDFHKLCNGRKTGGCLMTREDGKKVLCDLRKTPYLHHLQRK